MIDKIKHVVIRIALAALFVFLTLVGGIVVIYAYYGIAAILSIFIPISIEIIFLALTIGTLLLMMILLEL